MGYLNCLTDCGWLRNPAPPKGWLKPQQNNGMFTIYQLVQDFATIRSILTQVGFFVGEMVGQHQT